MQKITRDVGLLEKVGKVILISTIVIPVFALIARITYIYVNKVNIMNSDNCYSQKQFEKICTVPDKIKNAIFKYGQCV